MQLNTTDQQSLAISTQYQSELLFRTLLDKLPVGAYTCDSEGLITYFNQHAVQVWGREPSLNDPGDRFCGSFKLFSSDGQPIKHDECWMALALKHGREFNGCEIIVERPNGQRLTALAHANPIWDEVGELVGAVNVLVDISERKQLETQLMDAFQRVMSDTSWFAQKVMAELAQVRNGSQQADPSVNFSKREREVLEHIARGAKNDAIAQAMGLTVPTVRNYISTIYSKLGVHSRAEAVVWARERGII